MKGIAILGATGSIGRSALAVLDQHPDRFRAVALTAGTRGDALGALAERYRP
ncbi:MAG: 1-deoxy-D-xylulose-5-phosphate reductoisomerase, partial [Gemmatimonadetes bacterium]|nr:1-deoxy-D-xylulose-5-phosphate reductoisomerase [Gemmatimonadota bacterium]